MSPLAAHPRTMVCTEIPSAQRLPTLLATFDALLPGESFEVRSDHAPKGGLAHLKEERRGLFDWSPVEEGPEVWRTEITRRTAHAGDKRSVTEALEWDHDRLDALESEAFAARAAGDLALATRRFHEFAHGLRRHIAFEEALLFPAFESRAGGTGQCGPTAVMRAEHREIEQRLHDMECRFTRPEDPMTGARAAFHEIMREHNAKEEQVLYPATDRLLSESERDELVGSIQAFSR